MELIGHAACFVVFRRATLRPPVAFQPCPVLCTSPAARDIAADPAMGTKGIWLIL